MVAGAEGPGAEKAPFLVAIRRRIARRYPLDPARWTEGTRRPDGYWRPWARFQAECERRLTAILADHLWRGGTVVEPNGLCWRLPVQGMIAEVRRSPGYVGRHLAQRAFGFQWRPRLVKGRVKGARYA